MEWHHPEWLYLILPLAAAWLVLSLYSRRRRRRAAAAFVAQAMWSRILPADSRARFWAKLLLRETAIVTGLVTLAGPRFGTQYEEVVPRGADLYVLIDVSRSMLAQDVPPSRLGRAKADVAALVNRLEGERVGLIAFAGQAVVKCPLTVDYDAFRRSLDELDPGSAPRGGTAIGDAIRKALEVFQPRSDRDQAIVLITDGDDQQSYPREAAAIAAERHVTVFTVGLGDADHGARIPQGAESKSYVEYHGQQVWTKLDGSLLKDIALKTSGVYVPVGTRAYDLGELYAKYLQGRRGSDEQSHKRIRRADQFQIFLALTLLALLADSFTCPYPASVTIPDRGIEPRATAPRRPSDRSRRPSLPISTATVLVACFPGISRADNPAQAVREGLRSYGKGEFDKARDRFAAAREQLDNADASKAAIAAFDLACASHRKGDVAQAREWYLKAGLAHDKGLAASAHFNLGTLAAEEARRLAGEHPESVAADKRPEILDQLKAAVASFRHCLELQPDNPRARRDIELVRQWIKYYSDRWQAHDLEKRHQETNLVAFLEFLIETQRALRESVKALTATATADDFAEPKRLQEELQEEITPLKEKIKAELAPQQTGKAGTPQGNPSEIEKGIVLLQDWADAAGEKMSSAAHHLGERQAGPAAADQQSAIDELEKIWDARDPPTAFAHCAIWRTKRRSRNRSRRRLRPIPNPRSNEPHAPADESRSEPETEEARIEGFRSADRSCGNRGRECRPGTADGIARSERGARDATPLKACKSRGRAGRDRNSRSRPPLEHANEKAQAPAKKDPPDADPAEPKPVDPKQVKAGYQKAIELAPRAVEQMDQSVKALKQKNSQAAYLPAEAARKTLEEIQKAQPKKDEQDKKQQDQNKKNEDQQKKDQKDQQQQEQHKKDEQKKDEQKKDEQKKDQEQKKQEEPNKSDQQKTDEKQQQPQISRDRIEEAARGSGASSSRIEATHERDRRMKARVLGGVPVEKDW